VTQAASTLAPGLLENTPAISTSISRYVYITGGLRDLEGLRGGKEWAKKGGRDESCMSLSPTLVGSWALPV
jgi:hypothetical protein